jgi:hypothetical protein
MYVVNTRWAENGRRLVKIREFMGKVISHGVVPEIPPACSPDAMLREMNEYVAARGGSVRNPLPGEQQAVVAGNETDSDHGEEAVAKATDA